MIQVMDINYKALYEAELKRVKHYKSTQEIWRKLEHIHENKIPKFSEKREECSTSKSCEEENIDDVIIQKIIRNLHETLRKANELNKILKSQLNKYT